MTTENPYDDEREDAYETPNDPDSCEHGWTEHVGNTGRCLDCGAVWSHFLAESFQS